MLIVAVSRSESTSKVFWELLMQNCILLLGLYHGRSFISLRQMAVIRSNTLLLFNGDYGDMNQGGVEEFDI